MSFIDGFVGAARTVFGGGSDHSYDPTLLSIADPGDQPASPDTSTSFVPTAPPARALPTLGERFASIPRPVAPPSRPAPAEPRRPVTVETREPAPTAPHVTGSDQVAPPRPSTPVQPTRDQPPSDRTGGPLPNGRERARAVVYDAGTKKLLGDSATLTGNDDASAAARNVQMGLDYFSTTFGRNGLDGAGSGVAVLIRDRSLDDEGKERFAGNGGYYATTQNGVTTEAIHFGTGTQYDAGAGTVDQHAMLYAEDLAVHELVHGVIRQETGYLGGEADEAGATNEGIADVMAASATRDWSLGESMYAADSDYRRMRNIAQPDDPTAIHGLWTTMAEIEVQRAQTGEAEEHWASGVISTAGYRVQQRLGGEAGWAAVERIFYDAIHSGRLGDMSFGAVASGLRAAAVAQFGAGSPQAQAMDEELRRGGL